MSAGAAALIVFAVLIIGGCLVWMGWYLRGTKAGAAVAATAARTAERKAEAKREAAAGTSEDVLEEMQE